MPHGDGPVLFLPSSIPNLCLDFPTAINSDGLRVVLDSHSGDADVGFLLIMVCLDDVGFTGSTISDHDD